MSTVILNKEKFMQWIDKNVGKNEIVLMSADLTGSVTVDSKRNEKRVTFSFVADAFKRKHGIAHIAFGQTPCVAFSICKKEYVSDESLKTLSDSVKTKRKTRKT